MEPDLYSEKITESEFEQYLAAGDIRCTEYQMAKGRFKETELDGMMVTWEVSNTVSLKMFGAMKTYLKDRYDAFSPEDHDTNRVRRIVLFIQADKFDQFLRESPKLSRGF